MNKTLLCLAAIVLVANAAKLVKLKRRANGAVHSINDMSKMAFGGESGNSVLRPTTEESIPSSKGVSRYRLKQVYQGLDVLGSVAEAEIRRNGEPSGQVYGHVARDIQLDIPDVNACTQDAEEMVGIAITNEGFGTDDSRIDEKDCQRYIYIDPESEKAALIYRVQFFFADGASVMFPAYYIDACNKRVMFSYNQVQNATVPGDNDRYFPKKRQEEEDSCETDGPTQAPTTQAATQAPTTQGPPGACSPSAAGVGGNPKRGRIDYNQNGQCLSVQQNGATCTMSNEYAVVVDNEGTTSRSKSTPLSFNCNEGHSDPVNEAYGVANDAMYFGDITGRLYVEKYGVRALPYAPKLVVHYGSCYDNAFWNGVDMFFGDGCSYFYPLVSQDVVTHELGHGITSRNSDLEYRRQSGGINEAFSDISGEVAKVFNFGENDWRVGFNIFKSPSGALRYFINPADDGRSIKHADDYYDGLDVHYSSGVYNHAFYQLVAIQGMAIYDAYQCFLTANLGLWGPTTNYVDGACGVMQACYDHGLDTTKVLNAFSVVGIDISSCDFDALETEMALGETRDGILVSSTHNPIIKIDLGSDKASLVTARAPGGIEVQITASSDSGGLNVLTSGTHSIVVESQEESFAYVKLSLDSAENVEVSLTIENP